MESNKTAQEILQRSAALFLLKMKEVNRVTQVALNEIVEGVTELFETHASAGNFCSAKPFAGLETCYLQQKYYKQEIVVSKIMYLLFIKVFLLRTNREASWSKLKT